MSNSTIQKRKKTSIGGQALIEGIMMRGPEVTSMAVRHRSGVIVTEQWVTKTSTNPIRKWAFVRGVLNMVSSMAIGYKTLMRSAELSGLDDDDDVAECDVLPAVETTDISDECEVSEAVETIEAVQPAAVVPTKQQKKGEKILFTVVMVLSVLLGVALAVGLFMVLPTFLYGLITRYLLPALEDNRWTKSIFEGFLRIALFIGYVSIVSLMKDIKRVFMYHGAEHKSIFCYEAGEELTVENVRKQSRFHPRCGTSFMVLMLIVGIITSLFIPPDLVGWLRICIKLATLPLVVGIGYELIKLAGRKDNWFTRAISVPGMWVQRITTKEPDDGMIECAIQALNLVIPEDKESDNW